MLMLAICSLNTVFPGLAFRFFHLRLIWLVFHFFLPYLSFYHAHSGFCLQVCENHPQGVVLVKFKDRNDAQKCIELMNGRW